MGEKQEKPIGRYVPICSRGQVRFYLPLEKCGQLEHLEASGYEVAGEGRALVALARLLKEAEGRRAQSEERKWQYVADSLQDFSREAGSLDVLCPFCLGRINSNWPSQEGEVLCGWHDEATGRCDGNAAYSIDRAHLVLGLPEVEVYTCRPRKTSLDLGVYDLRRMGEEIEIRSRTLRSLETAGEAAACDAELARILPLRVGLRRTRRSFRDFVFQLMQKDAIVWLNTLSLEELAGLLDRAAGPDLPSVK